MKKMLKVSLIAIMLIGVSYTVHAQKFGYINSSEILAMLPEVKQADSALETLQKQLQKQGQGMVENLQKDYLEVQKKVELGDLSPKAQETEAKRLEAEQAKIAQFEQSMVQKISDKRKELLDPIYKKMNDAIASVAKEGGYQFIFDQQVLLYSEATQDISAQVKAKLGL